MIKLHLGCGNKIIPGFTNIDIVGGREGILRDDVSELNKIDDNSVDLIYACHVLEHFGRQEYKNVLQCWYTKLKTGGKLRISVPNFDAAVGWYQKNKKIEDIMGLLCGGQRNLYDYHKVVFDFEKLSKTLEDVGFKEVKHYDWRKTSHSHIDDYSQAYLPHMDKEDGLLMSLNVEAKK